MKLVVFSIKACVLIVPTFIVIYVTGTVSITALIGLVGGTPHLLVSRDLAGVPFIYYAFARALPLAAVATGVVWVTSTIFAAIGDSHKRFLLWFIFLPILGGVTGACAGVAMIGSTASELQGSEGPFIATMYLAGFVSSGLLAGAILSPIWYLAYHRSASP